MCETIEQLKRLKFSIGWLDISDQIQNFQAQIIAKNLTDFNSYEFTFLYDIKSYYDNDIDNLIKNASIDNDWILILSIGSFIEDRFLFEIFKNIKTWQKAAAIGHVLDKKQGYYKLHHQAILVNLKWYRLYNCPKFGQSSTEIWQAIKPLRSENNFHSDYTPKWIKNGNDTDTYYSKNEGWNFIKTALESGYGIYPFNETLRNSKFNIYPENEIEWPMQLIDLMEKSNTNIHFLANNEEKINVTNDIYGTFDACIIPASGFNSVIMPFRLGMKNNTKVIIYDISPIALTSSEVIVHNYKGQDIKDFWDNYIINPYIHYAGGHRHAEMQTSINEEINAGLLNWINNVMPTITYQYKKINILNPNDHAKLYTDEKRVYLHMSNIFSYFPTSVLFSTKDKILLHNRLLENLKSTQNTWYLCYRGFEKNKINDYLTNVKNAVIAEELKLFPWNN